MKIAIIKFEKSLEVSILKSINFPSYVLEKWCAACKIEFISDQDYDIKKQEILNLIAMHHENIQIQNL